MMNWTEEIKNNIHDYCGLNADWPRTQGHGEFQTVDLTEGPQIKYKMNLQPVLVDNTGRIERVAEAYRKLRPFLRVSSRATYAMPGRGVGSKYGITAIIWAPDAAYLPRPTFEQFRGAYGI